MALHRALSFLLLLQFSQAALALASGELLLSRSYSSGSIQRADFPKDFIFGAATSAYQVEGAVTEGGRGISIWDTWAHAGFVPITFPPIGFGQAWMPIMKNYIICQGRTEDGRNGDVTADQYHHYEEDVELLASMNMEAYRFSIAWPRIFPDGYGPEANKEGIAYYNRLINSLLRRGIKPVVTIFHWDLPQALQDSFGGWIDRQIVDHFVDFAEACFTAFGDRVKTWITMNEPGLYAYNGYSDGSFPPGRTSSPETEVYLVAHNFLLAHGAAVDMYRKKYQTQQKGIIGITIESEFGVPLTNSSEDIDAAQRRNEFQIGWFLDPIFFGDYPAVMRQNVDSRLPRFSPHEISMLQRSSDFIGFNHYTSRWLTTGPGPLPGSKSTIALDQRVTRLNERHGIMIGPQSASKWLLMVPWGLHALLKWTAARYDAPIYITENGMDNKDTEPWWDSLHDSRRVQFYQEYLAAMLQAIREGVDVRAYFAWSLLDNFEWAGGFRHRFGIVYVDYENGQKRYPKDSALWFQQFLQPSEANDQQI